jgi:hypothetical protein
MSTLRLYFKTVFCLILRQQDPEKTAKYQENAHPFLISCQNCQNLGIKGSFTEPVSLRAMEAQSDHIVNIIPEYC